MAKMTGNIKVIVARNVRAGNDRATEMGLSPREYKVLTPLTVRGLEGLRFTRADVIYDCSPLRVPEVDDLIARTDIKCRGRV